MPPKEWSDSFTTAAQTILKTINDTESIRDTTFYDIGGYLHGLVRIVSRRTSPVVEVMSLYEGPIDGFNSLNQERYVKFGRVILIDKEKS